MTLDAGNPPSNRLRPHLERERMSKPLRRTQREIVAEYREDIIALIQEDGAGVAEVAAAVAAQGERVLLPGFKSAVLHELGSVKAIRAGRGTGRPEVHGVRAAAISEPGSVSHVITEDDDDEFAARRRRD
mgnify:CR=1 FL=1